MSPHAHAPHGSVGGDRALGFGVVTVSDTRTEATDESGRVARELVDAAGHRVVASRIVADEMAAIREVLTVLLERDDVDVVVLTGGTGVSPRDVTPEAVRDVLDKELPGFGELFRLLSWEEVGARAVASRALGGVARGRPVFALPGSPKAVRLALSRLVLPEAGHLRELATV